ncbi:MAG: thioredoxin [Bacteroidota bacterium]
MKKIVLYSLVLLMGSSCNQAANDNTNEKADTLNKVTENPQLDTTASKPAVAASWKGILKITDAGFAEKIAATPGLTVVDFSAEWCGPCKQLHPILESLAKQMEGKVNFANVDVDESPNIATELAISSIPLLVFYKDGKIVDKTVGLLPEADIKAKINEHL